jgi:hypothetical protein
MSTSVSYFHRSYSNHLVNKNLDVTPSDYDPYCITVPVDPRLPGSGNRLCGFYDIKMDL